MTILKIGRELGRKNLRRHRRSCYHRRDHAVRWGIRRSLGIMDSFFGIVNVFAQVYFLRDGSGIGVFAQQDGARRGFFGGISQKF
jgi:hypothetical protein